jgi:erythronate-4-phosphate dehydrogenase
VIVVADENIPFVADAFGGLGDVRLMPGRAMSAQSVRDATVLLVRSVTRVDGALLDGSAVRFVATATIGTDHVDRAYLKEHDIGFAAAPGSNAQSVAEYVCAALLALQERGLLRLPGATLGVVGVGNVGGKVVRVGQVLRMRVLRNDPPRARREGAEGFSTLDEVVSGADVVTFHVPLERGGEDPTFHLVDAALIDRLGRGAVLVNTSRGAVADTAALKKARQSGRLGALVLDVWEGEPDIDVELMRCADLATPHIAGYSFDGKVAGTRMIHEAACAFLGVDASWPEGIPPAEDLRASVDGERILDAVRASYDICADDARMRRALELDDPRARASAFDRLRKEYPRRREFATWRIGATSASRPIVPVLEELGFVVESVP